MIVLICGSRHWTDYNFIYEYLVGCSLCKDNTVIHGGCEGADVLGGRAAESLGTLVEIYPANWRKYGNSAGPIRNKRMLDEGRPDVVLAFHNDLENSKGTKHMVKIALEAGIPVYLNGERYG